MWKIGLEKQSACKSTYSMHLLLPSHVYLVDDSWVNTVSTWYQVSGGMGGTRGWWLALLCMFDAFLHGGRKLISTSWSWGESFCKLCMMQNVHIVVVEYRTYNCIACTWNIPRVMWHVKRSSKGQKTSRIPVIWVYIRWVVSPFPTKARVFVAICESV